MPRRSNGSPPEKADVTKIRFTEVTRATRTDFESLFEQPGGPKYCWCMAWRNLDNREHAGNDERKRAMMALISAGTPVGILAHVGGKTVGWCSVAPREMYRRLSRQQDDSESNVWSIVCFYVPRMLRPGLSSTKRRTKRPGLRRRWRLIPCPAPCSRAAFRSCT
ncbi:hypothetical protein MESS4_590069 [Mesorhizobium sp. STM 4661]|nr:hypothetical protein MESS4_590069 [Mesorhizobium sp. STM 4661]